MAGLAKPNIENLKKEGKIKFLEYDNRYGYDPMESLIDGDINSKTYFGLLLFEDSPILKFELLQDSNIYAYGKDYSDRGGVTPKPVKIYKEIDGQFEYLKTVPTKANEWYLLCDNLEKGIYQLECTGRYTNFTEFYIEANTGRYFIMQNNKYFSIKPEYYNVESKRLNPIGLVGSEPNEEEINELAFDDINILTELMTVGEESFRPIDKLDDNFRVELYKNR